MLLYPDIVGGFYVHF